MTVGGITHLKRQQHIKCTLNCTHLVRCKAADICSFSMCQHAEVTRCIPAAGVHVASFPALICFALHCTDQFQVDLPPVFIQQATQKNGFNNAESAHCVVGRLVLFNACCRGLAAPRRSIHFVLPPEPQWKYVVFTSFQCGTCNDRTSKQLPGDSLPCIY